MERFFCQISHKPCTFQKWFYNWFLTLSWRCGAIFLQIGFIVFFFDSRAKARLIHLDSFLKPNFPRFFRKVKISWLSKNGLVIGTRRLVKTMGTFLKNLLTLPSSFFCFLKTSSLFFCVFFFVEHLVSFLLWWRLVVYLSQLSCQCCGHYFFAENSVSSLPLFFSFLNKLLLMLIFFVENGVTCVFTSKEVPDSIFRVFVDVVFFAKPSMFPFFFEVWFFLVCAFLYYNFFFFFVTFTCANNCSNLGSSMLEITEKVLLVHFTSPLNWLVYFCLTDPVWLTDLVLLYKPSLAYCFTLLY